MVFSWDTERWDTSQLKPKKVTFLYRWDAVSTKIGFLGVPPSVENRVSDINAVRFFHICQFLFLWMPLAAKFEATKFAPKIYLKCFDAFLQNVNSTL